MTKKKDNFLHIKRQKTKYRPVRERRKDYREIFIPRSDKDSQEQTSRCMECGTPFCHWACPLGNHIPEWNDLIANGKYKEALSILQKANNMPEITGRICPALCEYGCVLGINDEPVTIRENELALIEYGFKNNLIKPRPPKRRTGKRVAVIGSGPAGLSTGIKLNKAGHKVTIFEKDDKIGGILRYGIPDFKLDKVLLERRLKLWKKEGIEFKSKVNIGKDIPVKRLKKEYDAICLAIGSSEPRNLNIPGRGLKGIYFAMDYLKQSNKRVSGQIINEENITAKGKDVLIIGGGDTGADCVGTTNRQGAKSVTQVEILPKPPQERTESMPWPEYPFLLKNSTSHEEGCKRIWSVLTKRFVGEKGRIKKVSCVKVKFRKNKNTGKHQLKEIPGTEFNIKADLVILAIGFLHPEHKGLVKELGIDLDPRGNIKTNPAYQTSQKGIFAAGDANRGQSLVVWAIYEGINAAKSIDRYLKT